MMSTNKKPKSSSCPFAGAKKAPKQEQLLSLTTKEKDESQDDDEMVSASRAKIFQRTTEESQGTERQES